MAFMNTTVTRGRAEMVVTATGMNTEIGRIAGPVSYTHLRAHETVLDLVCRLLLEKKKKKKPAKSSTSNLTTDQPLAHQ